MDDQLQDHPREAEYAVAVDSSEAATQLPHQVQALEQRDEQHQTGERSQAMIFEGKLGKGMDTADGFCFAGLHRKCPPGLAAESLESSR